MSQAFVIPHGVVFAINDDGVVIENEGDVELHTDFGGRTLARVVSHEGNIQLDATSLDAGQVIASGELTTTGALKAQSVRARSGTLPALDVGSLNFGGNGNIVGHLRADQADVGGNLEVGSVAADGLRVGGDLHVHGTLDARVLEVGGTITVDGRFSFDVLDVAGTIRLAGDVTGKTLIADVVELGTGSVSVRGIQARTRIVIGAARLTVDAIVAPEVILDPGATGRATVIESHNEVARAAIKGGFRLAEVGEMFGTADTFLAERGLSGLGAGTSTGGAVAHEAADEMWQPAGVRVPSAHDAAAEEAPVEGVAAEEATAEEAPADEVPADDIPAEEASAEEASIESDSAAGTDWAPADETPAPHDAPAAYEAEPAADVEPIVIREYSGEPPTADPLDAAAPLSKAVEHPLHPQLASTVQRIVDCYADSELPPAVDRLRALVEARTYPDIRAEITNIWSELLKYHQKKGIRIHHQVTTTFNSVNSLVKKM